MIPAKDALALLREGNRRFVADFATRDSSRVRRIELAAGQEPFAAILGCSDSRVPVEIVFDQGLGDLFVIRVAGNIVAPSQIGSVEFAAEQFGTRWSWCSGIRRCGAIETTLEQLQRPKENQSRNLHSIVDLVRPSVEACSRPDLRHDLNALMHQAVRANIRPPCRSFAARIGHHRAFDPEDGLLVVGAEYSLETGMVDFFEGVAETAGDEPCSQRKCSIRAWRRKSARASRHRDHASCRGRGRGGTSLEKELHGAQRLSARGQRRHLADTSCGYGCIANLPEGATGFTTIELKSNHLGTALEGTIACRATPVHLGKTTQVWDAVVTHKETGRTLALFRCTQMILYRKPK
jgi:carbonic anhydrase